MLIQKEMVLRSKNGPSATPTCAGTACLLNGLFHSVSWDNLVKAQFLP